MSSLQSLVVDLQLNSAAMRKGLDEANAKLKGFGGQIEALGKKLSSLNQKASFDLGKDLVKGLAEFMLKGTEAADQMGKIAQSAGVAVEPFSKMAYGARLSGVSLEDLGGAFSKLNKQMAEAGAGSKDQASLFAALDVKVKDASGNLRASDEVMADLADRFSDMKDGAAKSALAMEVFGKSGASLIPFLNNGKDGLAELAAEADRLGITITGGASAAAEQFNDNLEKLKMAGEAVAVNASAQITPALTRLTEQLLSSADGTNALKGASEVLATALKLIASGAVIVGAVFDVVGTTIARVAAAAVAFASGEFAEAADLMKGYILGDDLVKSATTAYNQLNAIWDSTAEAAKTAGKKIDEEGKRSADATIQRLEREKKARTELEAAIKKQAAEAEASSKTLSKLALDLETELKSFGQGDLAKMEARLWTGDLADQLAKAGGEAYVFSDRILNAAQALDALRKASAELDINFDLGQAGQGLNRDVNKRKQNFGNIGKSDADLLKLKTKGFNDFDDAMSKFAQASKREMELRAQAAKLELSNDHVLALSSRQLADDQHALAEAANEAASAFEDIKRNAKDPSLLDSLNFENVKNMGQGAAGGAFGAIGGKAGEMGGAVLQGAQSGGVYGALIAGFMEILKNTSNFAQLTAKINKQWESTLASLDKGMTVLVDAFMAIADASQPIVEVTNELIEGILPPIANALRMFAEGLKPFGAIVAMLMKPLAMIGGIFEMLAPVFQIVARSIWEVTRALALGIMGFAGSIADAWNWIIERIADATRFIVDFITLGKGGADAYNKVMSAKINKQGIDSEINKWMNASFGQTIPLFKELGDAMDNATTATNDTAESMKEFNESLLNAPKLFKRNAAAMAAADAPGGGARYVSPEERRAKKLAYHKTGNPKGNHK